MNWLDKQYQAICIVHSPESATNGSYDAASIFWSLWDKSVHVHLQGFVTHYPYYDGYSMISPVILLPLVILVRLYDPSAGN